MLTLHSFWRSSCAYRVRIALAMKRIPYKTVSVDILAGQQHTDAYGVINPLRQVPVLEITLGDGSSKYIPQSIAIAEYLEEMYPQTPLLPKSPLDRAAVRAVCAAVTSGIQPFQNTSTLKWIRDTAAASSSTSEHSKFSTLQRHAAYASTLTRWTDTFVVGNIIKLEHQMWSALRFTTQQHLAQSCPTLTDIVTRLYALPEVQAAAPEQCPDYTPEKEKHAK